MKNKLKLLFLTIALLAVPRVSDAGLVSSSVRMNKTNDQTTSFASNLVGWWSFEGSDTGLNYTLDKSGNGFTATTTAVTLGSGRVGQALGFNLASSPTWNQGLVGWWNMDTNRIMGTAMTDLSPSGYTGTLSGATLPSSVGSNKYGQALSFDGSTSYVDMGNVLNNDSDLTLAVWVNTSSIGHTSLDTIVAKSGVGSDFDLLIDTATGNIFGFYISNTTTNFSVKSTTAASLNNWQHVVAVWDKTADTLKIYVNGILENTTSSVTGDRGVNSNNFCIGKSCNNANRLFAGKIDDVRMYNRALSATEITELYRGSSYANISPTTNLNTFTLSSTQGISLGTWVKFASSTGNQILMRKSDTATSSNSYELKSNGTNFQLQIGTTTSVTITGTTSVKPNRWYYVTGTADSSNMRLYVNGTEEASATVTGTAVTSVSPTVNNWGNSLFFGMDDSPANFFIGWLDDPRIYSRALSANEIKQIYTQGNRAITTSVPKPAQSNLLTNLVGWWTFDGKDCGATYCVDKSGNNNTSAFTNEPVRVTGKIGQAISFDGVNDYLNIPDSASLRMNNGSLTAAFWMKPSSANAFYAPILGKRLNAAPYEQYSISVNSNDSHLAAAGRKISFAFIEDSNSIYRSGYTTNDVVTPNWTHVVVVLDKDANLGKIYINGQSVAVTMDHSAGAWPTIDNTDALEIARHNSTDYFPGKMDDVRIYSRALSANEIKQIYTQGNRAITTAVPKPAQSNLLTNIVGWWTFDGKDTGAAYTIDKSGNNNTGTLTGTRKVPGKVGQALLFNSSASDEIALGNPVSLQITDDIAMASWVYITSTAQDRYVVVAKDDATGSRGYVFDILAQGGSSPQPRLFINTPVASSGQNVCNTNIAYGPTISLNKWYHFVVQKQGTALSIYTNGQLSVLCSTSADAAINNSTASAFIGARTNASVNFNGRLDDVRIYNRALSASEVYQLYRLGQ